MALSTAARCDPLLVRTSLSSCSHSWARRNVGARKSHGAGAALREQLRRPVGNLKLHSPSVRRPFRLQAAVAEQEPPSPAPPPAEDAALKAGIAQFYDASSGLWEDMWGEHMHHGYYPPGGQPKEGPGGIRGHQLAQEEMIEQALSWAGVRAPRRILDVGCGIGGSSRYLARKYPGAQVTGITLSPRQAQRGNRLCLDQGLQEKVELRVADAMASPFADGSFDFLWSMESGEHMPNKPKFVGELARLAAPGGKILIVTWCTRNLDRAGGETQLRDWEKSLLDQICNAYYLPAWCSADDYVEIARDLGLKNVRAADWTEFVTPFWPAVIASALSWRGFVGLLQSGWTTMRGAIAMLYMVQGYSRGLIKFVIVTADK